MARGRKKTRTGDETQSTFEKTPELELAILDLQRRYLQSGRSKPTMRELLTEGIALLLEKEDLPAMPEPRTNDVSVIIQMPKKTGA
jgi:hypothetical protein